MADSSEASSGIIVGVDGSAASDAAVRWATQEAVMRKSALTVVNALIPVMTWPQVPVPPGVDAWQEAESQTGRDRRSQHRPNRVPATGNLYTSATNSLSQRPFRRWWISPETPRWWWWVLAGAGR